MIYLEDKEEVELLNKNNRNVNANNDLNYTSLIWAAIIGNSRNCNKLHPKNIFNRMFFLFM